MPSLNTSHKQDRCLYRIRMPSQNLRRHKISRKLNCANVHTYTSKQSCCARILANSCSWMACPSCTYLQSRSFPHCQSLCLLCGKVKQDNEVSMLHLKTSDCLPMLANDSIHHLEHSIKNKHGSASILNSKVLIPNTVCPAVQSSVAWKKASIASYILSVL